MRLRTIKSRGNIRKIAVEKFKKTQDSKKNRAWNIPQIKTIKESHELGLIRPQTQHKAPKHSNLKFLTPSVEKIVTDHRN
jgi:hypothetical protein